MGKCNSAVRRYLRLVRSWLPCSGKMKREIMQKIRIQAETFVAENPNADYAALEARFGTPKQIASSYVDEMGTDQLLEHLRIRKNILRIVTFGVLAIVLIWISVVSMAYYQTMNEREDRYFVETIQQES